MASALDTARLLIRLAVTGEEPDPLNHLRLQKLLYYVQAWHLAAFGRPMFRERIEAWCNGPVVADLWPHFKRFGYSSILPEESDPVPGLSRDEQAFVRSVWDEYKRYSAIRLSEMTHNEDPWRNARGDLPADARSSVEITADSMRAYFAPLLAARMPKGISLEQVLRAEEGIDKGRFRTHQQIKARLARS